MPIQIDSNSFRAPVIGIDLGTTHSLVAIVKDGKPLVLNSREGKRLLPSIVSFVNGQPVVGYQAKKKKVRDAHNTVFSVKRLLGRGFEDLSQMAGSVPYQIIPGEGIARIQVENRVYTAVEISAIILKELKLSAEQELGVPVSRAVITVPAYFNDAQRQATRTAGRLAGLDVLRIINEPTAASLAYGLNKKKQGLIAVYDLGGGTFDISILKLHDGIFEVLSTSGDTTLGGDDLDLALVQEAKKDIAEKWGSSILQDIHLQAALLEVAENVKINLSHQTEALFEVSVKGEKYVRNWTRQEFERLVRPILDKTQGPCLKALKDAGLRAEELSDVVLVGGPTRLKIVQEVAAQIFNQKPNTSVHPDEVVAEGAAIQADILAGNNKELLLLDVVPLSLGIETYGGVMSTLIQRNTRIPTVAREAFTTFVDNQTAVDIHVLQGEREKVEENRSLARFKLKGIQPLAAGMPRVEVSFLIDADGILQVSAKDMRTGNEQSIEVKPTYGLTDAEVEKMLQSGLEHAEEDAKFKKLTEAKNEADPVLRAAEIKVQQASQFVSKSDLDRVQTEIKMLKTALGQSDTSAIEKATAVLKLSTVELLKVLSGK